MSPRTGVFFFNSHLHLSSLGSEKNKIVTLLLISQLKIYNDNYKTSSDLKEWQTRC